MHNEIDQCDIPAVPHPLDGHHPCGDGEVDVGHGHQDLPHVDDDQQLPIKWQVFAKHCGQAGQVAICCCTPHSGQNGYGMIVKCGHGMSVKRVDCQLYWIAILKISVVGSH
jgi:hypothetical protein